MSLKNVSEWAAKIAPTVVDKVFMPAVSIALTKHGDSEDQRKQVEANAAKLITDQMAVAIDLVIEASKTGNVTSGKALEAALKKFGATSSFWQSDMADCLVNVSLLTFTVGKTTTAVAAAPSTMGASTVVVVSNAIQIYADYLQMQTSCKKPAARAKKVIDDQLESFAAQFYRGFVNWIAIQAGPDFGG